MHASPAHRDPAWYNAKIITAAGGSIQRTVHSLCVHVVRDLLDTATSWPAAARHKQRQFSVWSMKRISEDFLTHWTLKGSPVFGGGGALWLLDCVSHRQWPTARWNKYNWPSCLLVMYKHRLLNICLYVCLSVFRQTSPIKQCSVRLRWRQDIGCCGLCLVSAVMSSGTWYWLT